MPDRKPPFQLLSDEDFQRLTTTQRAEYLRRAIAALDELKAQIAQTLRENNKPEKKA